MHYWVIFKINLTLEAECLNVEHSTEVFIKLFLSFFLFLYNGVCQDALKLSASDVRVIQKGSNGLYCMKITQNKNKRVQWRLLPQMGCKSMLAVIQCRTPKKVACINIYSMQNKNSQLPQLFICLQVQLIRLKMLFGGHKTGCTSRDECIYYQYWYFNAR